MKKLIKKDLFKYCSIIIPIFIGIFIFNHLTPLYADDYSYMYSFSTGQKINNILDIFSSMYSHYFSMNGRLILHFIAQLLLMLGDNIANIINSSAFIILGLLIYYHVYLSFKNVNILSLIFTYFSLFMFTPDFGQSYLWITGAANYLYGPLLFLIFLLPYRISLDKNKNISIIKSILYSIVAFLLGAIVGDTNENTAVTAVFIAFLFFVYRFFKYKNIPIWSITGFLGATITTCFNLFSPGTHNRLGEESINFFPIKNFFLYIFKLIDLFSPLLLIITILLTLILSSYKKSALSINKDSIKSFLSKYKIEIAYLIIFLVSYFSLIVISSPLRVLSGPVVYLTIFVLSLFKKYSYYYKISNYINTLLTVSILFIFIGSYINNLLPMKVVHSQYINRINLIYQSKQANNTTVFLPNILSNSKYSCFKIDGDLSKDPNSWQNESIAKYYGFDKVILEESNTDY